MMENLGKEFTELWDQNIDLLREPSYEKTCAQRMYNQFGDDIGGLEFKLSKHINTKLTQYNNGQIDVYQFPDGSKLILQYETDKLDDMVIVI